MAKVTGIDPGDFAVKAVMLDGSYRKTRLLECQVEPLNADDLAVGDRPDHVAEAVRHIVKEGHLVLDNARLGYPCREAVLRTIEVPFSGRDAIRKIIKSEVEGAIHSHSVDDMVVDFLEVGKGLDGSKVMVAAVPKGGLRVLLQALEKKSIEPEIVDLDTMALYRVAHWCGAFSAGEADAALVPLDEEEDGKKAKKALPPALLGAAGAGPRRITAVLDLGARSTRVLLVENDSLVEMRTLRIGDASLADDVARGHGISVAQAREVVTACLASGADQHVEALDAVPAPIEGEAAVPAAQARKVKIPYVDVEAAQTALLQRLARELARFLVSVGDRAKIDAVWITGGASRMTGVREMLQEVFGLAPRDLDVMARLQHSLSPEEAETVGPRLAIAIGLALGGLGGPSGFNLRQEDLAYTRGFDRIKFPLAIACMVALFAAVVSGVKLNNDLKNLEFRIGRTYTGPDANPKKPIFYGMLLATFPGSWFDDGAKFPREAYTKLMQELVETPVSQRISLVQRRLGDVVHKEQNDSGIYEDLTLESGLAVLVRFADVLESKKDDLGRFLLMKLTLSMASQANQRSLDFTVAFRGSDFRTRLYALQQALQDDCRKPDSPFLELETKAPNFKEHLFADREEAGVEGAYFDMRIKIKEQFEPFGGGQVKQ